MTSVKFSNLSKILLALMCAASALSYPSLAGAQDPNYAPPPMFEDMTPPMVRPEGQDGYLVTPKASENTKLPDPKLDRPPVVVPRVSVDPDAPVRPPAPTPAQTAPAAPVVPAPPVAPVTPKIAPAPAKPEMMKPIIEETYIKREKPAAKKETPKKKKEDEPRTEAVKKLAPTPVPSTPVAPVPPAPEVKPPSAEAPVIAPVARDPSQSAIKGPKTMPALPTETVDEQVIFDSKAPPPPQTIMERHQDEAKQETLMPIVPRPNPNVAPAAFDAGEQGVLKKSIVFQPGQIGLTSADADPIIAGVVKELDKKENETWRVQIRAFATPSGAGLSSDRRIALSRALSLRSSMIAQGVAANRIDVSAEGLQTEGGKPGDRIDLYLFGPPQE